MSPIAKSPIATWGDLCRGSNSEHSTIQRVLGRGIQCDAGSAVTGDMHYVLFYGEHPTAISAPQKSWPFMLSSNKCPGGEEETVTWCWLIVILWFHRMQSAREACKGAVMVVISSDLLLCWCLAWVWHMKISGVRVFPVFYYFTIFTAT